MSAAAVEYPCDDEPESLLESAHRLTEQLPGHRVEIIGGVITVAPRPDGPHANALTSLMVPFLAAGLHGKESRVLQGIGLWLPGGPQDYVIPDLALVDADFDAHRADNHCYAPAVFRLVLEVTSSNYRSDLHLKVAAYAEAKIPGYVILDRRHGRVHVLTEPGGSTYDRHEVYAPGQTVTLPASIGAEVVLDVAELVAAGSRTAEAASPTD
ncbi:Uma2 family endonuclease [Streptomyces sp. NPDC005576]|uniref:Uma2 family endonuclease n=1 Tax=Streptomyces sp. NPDC005576 TaxID=3364726 RepID=UPI0036BD1221